MALGNMTHAISMFSNGKGGLQRFTTKKHLLKIYGMVRAPSVLACRQAMSRLAGDSAVHHANITDTNFPFLTNETVFSARQLAASAS